MRGRASLCGCTCKCSTNLYAWRGSGLAGLAAVKLPLQRGETEMDHGRPPMAAALVCAGSFKLADKLSLLLRRQRLAGFDCRLAGDVGQRMLLPGLAMAGGLGIGSGKLIEQLT